MADSGNFYYDDYDELPKPTLKDKIVLTLIILGLIMLMFLVLVGIGF